MGKVRKNISVMSKLTAHLFGLNSSQSTLQKSCVRMMFMKALAKANLWLSALITLVTKLK